MNKIVEVFKNIYKENRYIFSIQFLLCLLVAFLYAFLRGLRYQKNLETTMAEYISNKVGFDFHPDWISTILVLIGWFLLFLLFTMPSYFSLLDIFSYFKKKRQVNSANTGLYKKKSKKKNRKRK